MISTVLFVPLELLPDEEAVPDEEVESVSLEVLSLDVEAVSVPDTVEAVLFESSV